MNRSNHFVWFPLVVWILVLECSSVIAPSWLKRWLTMCMAQRVCRKEYWTRQIASGTFYVILSHTPPESVYVYTQACKSLYEMLRSPIGYNLRSGLRSAGLGVEGVIYITNGKRIYCHARIPIHSMLSFRNSRGCLTPHSLLSHPWPDQDNRETLPPRSHDAQCTTTALSRTYISADTGWFLIIHRDSNVFKKIITRWLAQTIRWTNPGLTIKKNYDEGISSEDLKHSKKATVEDKWK